MKIYSVQPWIWSPSLRKSEAKSRIGALLSCHMGEQLDVLASAGHTAHGAVQLLVPRADWQSVFSHPVPLGSPGKHGSEQPGWKSHPQWCPCQQSLSWKLCSCEDCVSSSPKANAVNLGTLWGIWWKCACTIGRPGAESKRTKYWAVVGWTDLD